MDMRQAIELLKKEVPEPTLGLPDDVFYYVSGVTPLVNVDLLIKDERGRTLLAWRDDGFAGTGWHVPGGIVRFQETLEARVRQVAATEIGAEVSFDQTPVAINQFIHPERATRGHFVSILYKCAVPHDFIPQNEGVQETDPGYLRWHASCPDPLVPCHVIYRKYL